MGEGGGQPPSQVNNSSGFPSPKPRSVDKLQISDGDQYYNLDPLANEAPVYVDGVNCTSLIDLGSQMSVITTSFAKHLSLLIQPLSLILNIKAMGGGLVPYLGYVETHIQIPGVKKVHEDVLMLVFEDSPYGDRVPIQVGTLHIDMVIGHITECPN